MTKLRILTLFICAALSAPADAGNWNREEQVDRMTDKKSVWYWTESVRTFECTGGSSLARLFLSCTSTGAAALLGTTDCLFLDDEVFSFRVGEQSKDYVYSTPQQSGKSVHLGSLVKKDRADHLVGKMLSGETLLLEIKPYASPKVIIEFDVGNLSETVGPDFGQCLR